MKKIALLLLIIFIFNLDIHAQNPEYKTVDTYIQKLGSLDSQNVATISEMITKNFGDKKEKARAIFYWISNNISLDLKAAKQADDKKNDPVLVIKSRKATPLGYAMLFQEMSSQANIRCLIVDGYTRNNAEDINNMADDLNHAWNVVQLGQSPEQWFYVDACKASGYADKKFSVFTKQFTSEYFFADKPVFNLDHYPNNQAWLLGTGAKNLKDFYALPVIGPAAYSYSIQNLVPATGLIKTKTKAQVSFKFGIDTDAPISSVTMLVGDTKKQPKTEAMNFTIAAGKIVFQYQFKKDDTYPITIQIDGKDVLMYNVEATE